MDKNLLKTVLVEQLNAFSKRNSGIPRERLKKLKEARKSPHVVVISGLRRVGKSTLLRQMMDELSESKVYYVNFEDERLMDFTAKDADLLLEVLVELFGTRKILLLDEIQNIDGWERFVRRLTDAGYKFYLTGSNASLLSKELGNKLTGRYILVELFPFSFSEFLLLKGKKVDDYDKLTTEEFGEMKRLFGEYLLKGGIPEVLIYPKLDVLSTLYNDVIYRDITARYKVDDVKALKELSFYLLSNVANPVSFNKLKELLKLGSVNTVKNYIDYLQSSWLFEVVNVYDYSVKKQQIASKKVYAIDSGLINFIGFKFSDNEGRLLENMVFWSLRRKYSNIYYYKTAFGKEVDFYLPEEQKLIQVCLSLEDMGTKEREVAAIFSAMDELRVKDCMVLVKDLRYSEKIKFGGRVILAVPLVKWLLEC